jgi:hypothetical protein
MGAGNQEKEIEENRVRNNINPKGGQRAPLLFFAKYTGRVATQQKSARKVKK